MSTIRRRFSPVTVEHSPMQHDCNMMEIVMLRQSFVGRPSAMKAACQAVFHVGYGHNGITGRHQKVAR